VMGEAPQLGIQRGVLTRGGWWGDCGDDRGRVRKKGSQCNSKNTKKRHQNLPPAPKKNQDKGKG